MKSVLISIQPKWCELIASGKKTVEIRKTKPKIETPFKCYIYQTKKCWFYNSWIFKNRLQQGKVIGEFVCDEITEFYPTMDLKQLTSIHFQMCEKSCVNMRDLYNYANGKILYGWHMSDLVIYEQPKELREFYRWTDYDDSKKDKRPCSYCEHNAFDYSENCEYCSIDYDGEHCIHLQMKRPPQSWCYVDHPTEKGGVQE